MAPAFPLWPRIRPLLRQHGRLTPTELAAPLGVRRLDVTEVLRAAALRGEARVVGWHGAAPLWACVDVRVPSMGPERVRGPVDPGATWSEP